MEEITTIEDFKKVAGAFIKTLNEEGLHTMQNLLEEEICRRDAVFDKLKEVQISLENATRIMRDDEKLVLYVDHKRSSSLTKEEINKLTLGFE